MAADLVLLHGFTQTGASWEPVIRELDAGQATSAWRTYAPDLGGHGNRPLSSDLSFPGEVALLDSVTPPSFALAGYSMGGRIALFYSLWHPDRLSALILVSSGPGLRDPVERADRRRSDDALAVRILEDEDLDGFAREWAEQPLFADQPSHVAAAAHADRLRNTPEGLAASLRGLGTGVMPSLWDRLGEVTVPVTLIVGERDQKFRRINEQMVDLLPDARLVVIRGAGHAVHLEQPRAVARAIERAVR